MKATPHPIIAYLVARRRELGIPQWSMAIALSVSTPAFASWEQGRHEPHLALLTSWSALLGLRLDVVAGQAHTPQCRLELVREAS
jgi:DNA-binding XRE family transcriptional regulator